MTKRLLLPLVCGLLEPAAFSPFAITAPQISINNGNLEIRLPGQDNAAFFRLSSQ